MDNRSLPQLQRAQAPPEASRSGKQAVFIYPDPLTLARTRAEAEVRIVSDRSSYSAICRCWGRVGGMTTAKRYGRTFYRLLAQIRNGDESARLELTLLVERRREGS